MDGPCIELCHAGASHWGCSCGVLPFTSDCNSIAKHRLRPDVKFTHVVNVHFFAKRVYLFVIIPKFDGTVLALYLPIPNTVSPRTLQHCSEIHQANEPLPSALLCLSQNGLSKQETKLKGQRTEKVRQRKKYGTKEITVP